MSQLIDDYLAGPQKLHDAIAGMTEDQLDAKPVPGKWSTRQVVCHIADCEVVYADRMKRVIVEDNPAMLNLDPDTFAAGLAYDQRDVEAEFQRIEITRSRSRSRASQTRCAQRLFAPLDSRCGHLAWRRPAVVQQFRVAKLHNAARPLPAVREPRRRPAAGGGQKVEIRRDLRLGKVVAGSKLRRREK